MQRFKTIKNVLWYTKVGQKYGNTSVKMQAWTEMFILAKYVDGAIVLAH